MTEQTDRPARRRRLPVWLFVFFLALAVVSVLLHVEKSHRWRNFMKWQDRYMTLVQTRPVEGTKARRARFYRVQYYLGYPEAVSYAVANLVRRMENIALPLRLLSVQVDPGLNDMGFALTVGVAETSHEAAQLKFAVFFEKMQVLAGIVEAAFSPGERAADGLHVFVVSGRAELQP